MNDGLSVADVFAMTRNGEGSNGYGNGAWDNPFIYLVWLALLGGGGLWGNRNGGGFGGGGTDCGILFDGFNKQDVNGQLRGITTGLCDGFYAVNTGLLQGFNGIQRDLCSGFNGINAGITNLGYQMGQCCCGIEKGIMNSDFQLQAGINSLSAQLAKCRCDAETSRQNNTRAILDFLTQDKISSLTAENQALKFAASQSAQNAFITANQEAQTAELIRRLGRDCPIPAYVVPNPNCCYGNAWGAPYSNSCGCGCA